MRILKTAVVTSALAALTLISPAAQAVGQEPLVYCGDTVTWTADGGGGPGERIVRWAYSQVAPVTGITTSNIGWADVKWEWAGGSGRAYRVRTSRTPITNAWVHTLRGGVGLSDAEWRQVVLRQVVGDFGVTAPSSTAAGLSAGDRASLQSICGTSGLPVVVDDTGSGAAADGEDDSEPPRSEAPNPASGQDSPAAGDVGPPVQVAAAGDVGPVHRPSSDDGGGGLWILAAVGAVSVSTGAGAFLGARGRRVTST